MIDVKHGLRALILVVAFVSAGVTVLVGGGGFFAYRTWERVLAETAAVGRNQAIVALRDAITKGEALNFRDEAGGQMQCTCACKSGGPR